MTEQVTVKTGFKKLPDSDALALAGTVVKGVFVDKVIAAAPPFDEVTLQTAMDDLKGAIAAQAQARGGTVVTAVKKKKRNVLDALLRKLAHYVQANCNDDTQLVVRKHKIHKGFLWILCLPGLRGSYNQHAKT